MNWNIFWGIYILAFALACWVCFYIFGIRKWKKAERCSEYIVGRVVGVSPVCYAGIHIPLIEYMVKGKIYKVSGPKFRSGSAVQISTPFDSPTAQMETNLTTRENLPLHLKVKMRKNSSVNMQESPLFRLYPIGTPADVFYNPKKPKESFVQRYEGASKLLGILVFALALVLTGVGIFVLFGPPIIMS